MNYIFEGVNMTRQRRMQKSFVSGALGGKPYNGKSMKAAHKHLKLTDAHFNAVAENLEAALRHFNVSDEHVRQIMAVVETTRNDVLGRDAPSEAAAPVEAAVKPKISVDSATTAVPAHDPCLSPSVARAASITGPRQQ